MLTAAGTVLAALFALLVSLLAGTAPALASTRQAAPSAVTPRAASPSADTSGFKGVNWARIGDNFSSGPLVPQGLNLTDSYSTVQAKTNDMLTAFQSLGANTVRLPVNPASVNTDTANGPDWWDSYRAVIDTATARGFKVDLSYWNEGTPGGTISNLSTWNAMWNTITTAYLSNPLVYFDPMNEPIGYTTADWENIAAKWLTDRPSVPRNRVILAGGGWDWDVQSLCHDSRFDGTYLAFHHYHWDEDIPTYAGWVSKFQSYIGDCASRTILEEFGATMDSGLNYDDANSTNQEILYLRALTDFVRSQHMGAIWWAGIGGRNISTDSVGPYESLNIQRLFSSSVNTPLRTPNTTGLDRLRYAWGVGSGSATTTLTNNADGKCLDVPAGTHDNVQIETWSCGGGTNQQWTRTSTGQITVYNGEKCLDAYGGGTTNGTVVGTWSCGGGPNQQWSFYTDGTIRGVQSGRCLDVNTATHELELWTCNGGTNQQWKVV